MFSLRLYPKKIANNITDDFHQVLKNLFLINPNSLGHKISKSKEPEQPSPGRQLEKDEQWEAHSDQHQHHTILRMPDIPLYETQTKDCVSRNKGRGWFLTKGEIQDHTRRWKKLTHLFPSWKERTGVHIFHFLDDVVRRKHSYLRQPLHLIHVLAPANSSSNVWFTTLF